MLQSEIAGRTVASAGDYPRRGSVLRDFELKSAAGQPVLLSEYRGHSSLLLILAGTPSVSASLLQTINSYHRQLAKSEARILILVAGTQQQAFELKTGLRPGIEILADSDGRVHRAMGAVDRSGQIAPALFITDRFGEVFADYRLRKEPPSPDQILNWIDFIDRQCPECGPLEWPD